MGVAASSPNFNHGYPTPGPQAPSPQAIVNHVYFLTEERWKDVRENQQFDYIIIGSGICGYAFAERALAKRPHARILIIERGPFFLPEHFQNLPIPYQETLGGLSETFPWTLSAATALQPLGNISWQHGMVPFVGGRSIMWSSWCPRPTEDEMSFWPQATVSAAQKYFESAEKVLNVINADEINGDLNVKTTRYRTPGRPIYSTLQTKMQEMLAAKSGMISSYTRSMAAPMAVGAATNAGIDFAKFSVPPVLLDLIDRQAALASQSPAAGAPLLVVTECVVHRILRQGSKATALDTSRGVVNVGNAEIILAMGTLPPTTLIQNSFPEITSAGKRFTAHFITSVIARIKRSDYEFANQLSDLELAAIYMAGEQPDSQKQYHIQLSIISDKRPEASAPLAARYMPDVVATASPQQLANSKDYFVFVCAVLGELDFCNSFNHFRKNSDADLLTNMTLQVLANDNDRATWNTMDEGTFQMLELALSPKGAEYVEYWHGAPDDGSWSSDRPSESERRVAGLVHEGSTLWIGDDGLSPVGLDYRPFGIENVSVTGGALWPAGGSWNPTLTMVALVHDLVDKLEQHNRRNQGCLKV
jgi:choline dehydrogenase-like flavoprotein